MKIISIAKIDPKYGQCTTSVPEWPGYKEKNSFWSDVMVLNIFNAGLVL
jgi:hypothetical protein